jgi:hypothetical protein
MRSLILLAFLATGILAQYTCSRDLNPEIQDDAGMGNKLEWTYSATSDLLSVRLTLGARLGWVGIGFHNTGVEYEATHPMKKATLIVGFLYSKGGTETSCVTSWQGAVTAAGDQPAFLNKLPKINKQTVQRQNNEQLVMTLEIVASSINNFQATGGRLLISYKYSSGTVAALGGVCEDPYTATSVIATTLQHASKSTTGKQPRAIYHNFNWASCGGASPSGAPSLPPLSLPPFSLPPLPSSLNLCFTMPTTIRGTQPSQACMQSTSFQKTTAIMAACDVEYCKCVGGVSTSIGSNSVCSKTATCDKLSCGSLKFYCKQSAIENGGVAGESACAGVVESNRATSNCQYSMCAETFACTDDQYNAVCSGGIMTSYPSLVLMGVVLAVLGLIF